MLILAIETSCDDTGVAVLEVINDKLCLLSNVVSSQVKIHAPFGGVVPNLASRAHAENIIPCLRNALKQSGLGKAGLRKIDLIAVTVGPGLIPCLLIGVNAARALAYALNKPVIGVNHIEGHIVANLLPQIGENPKSEIPALPAGRRNSKQILNSKFQISKQIFPVVCLVVSGGHTQLILMKRFGDYEIIGETRDDAAGEAFDKVAKLLNLGYPGGPAIAAEAAKLKIKNEKLKIIFPRPMINAKNYDFSFSGLKTAALYFVKTLTPKEVKKITPAICAEFQQAAVDVLVVKTIRVAKEISVKTIILSGGVAANDLLRQNLKSEAEKIKLNFLVPPKNFCADNAAMIALAGYLHRDRAASWKEIEANANLRI